MKSSSLWSGISRADEKKTLSLDKRERKTRRFWFHSRATHFQIDFRCCVVAIWRCYISNRIRGRLAGPKTPRLERLERETASFRVNDAAKTIGQQKSPCYCCKILCISTLREIEIEIEERDGIMESVVGYRMVETNADKIHLQGGSHDQHQSRFSTNQQV